MRPLWSKGDVSVTRVAAAQTLLDITDICGDELPRLYGHLINAENHVRETLKLHVDTKVKPHVFSHGDLEWPTSDWAYESLFELSYIFDTTAKPRLILRKTDIMARISDPYPNRRPTVPEDTALSRTVFKLSPSSGRVDLDFIRPAKNPTLPLVHNPLWSGSAMLRLLLEYHRASLCAASYHTSISTTAHLYNAVRQLKMLDQPWPLMERIIELHKKSIFADVIPTKVLDMRNRFFYRTDPKGDLYEAESIHVLGQMTEDDFSTQSRALWLLE